MTKTITPYKGGRTERINARTTRQAKAKLVARAKAEGFATLADWLDAQSNYENSEAYHACMGAATVQQLLNRKRYTTIAIEYHQKMKNKKAEGFFKSDLALIEKQIAKMQKAQAMER